MRLQFLVGEIDADRGLEDDATVALAAEDGADRDGDLGRAEAGHGDLIQQRLEQVVIAPVERGDLEVVGAAEPASHAEAAETPRRTMMTRFWVFPAFIVPESVLEDFEGPL